MKLRMSPAAAVCLLVAALTLSPVPAAVAQQEAGQVHSPSKYLYLENVELKANQGSAFAKLEGQEADALRAANAPSHYVGMWAITGGDHVLFMHGFNSFADMQKDHEATMAMSKLQDTLNPDDAQEASLITERHSSIYTYEKDLSLGDPIDLSKMRFMRILLFHVRSGHGEEFEHVVKLFAKAYQSSIPEAHWVMFEKMYGVGSDNVHILVTPMESLSFADAMHDGSKKFSDAVGEDQLTMLRKSLDAAVESSEADLFAFGPKISYVPQSWITSSPDFWGKK
ncbi:MAG TPA: hypothetical protein VFE01_07855 [Terracidiphilus sp.]|jgi:hypothetical protein|nr:hypothetical protein [Terracidiphilus sp.]